jgi:hypothetical protein
MTRPKPDEAEEPGMSFSPYFLRSIYFDQNASSSESFDKKESSIFMLESQKSWLDCFSDRPPQGPIDSGKEGGSWIEFQSRTTIETHQSTPRLHETAKSGVRAPEAFTITEPIGLALFIKVGSPVTRHSFTEAMTTKETERHNRYM